MRRKGEDLLETILILINNTAHPMTRKIIPRQKELIAILREKERISRKELIKKLNLNFLKHPKGSKEYKRLEKLFYKTLSPLLNTVVVSVRGTDDVYYSLSYELFKAKLDSLRRAGQNYFRGEIQ